MPQPGPEVAAGPTSPDRDRGEDRPQPVDEASEPPPEGPESDRRWALFPVRQHSDRWAVVVFALYLLVALPLILFVFGDYFWFWIDDWDLLASRDIGDLGDIIRPHNEHWTGGPVVIYRLLYGLFGIKSYLPYQFVVVVAHLTTAALLRVVMRRAGAGPWIATAAASVFVLFGAGADNILWSFQIAFVGALALGLGHLILVDHDGPIGRRDWIGLALGAIGLTFSAVAVAMVFTVGLAALIRRGWRAAAFHTVPLAALFIGWYELVDPSPPLEAPVTSTSDKVDGIRRFVWAGILQTFEALGGSRVAGLLLAGLLVVGLVLAWSRLPLATLRQRASMPVALFMGGVAFYTLTGLGRWWSGPITAERSRYLHIAAACFLPALAVAAAAVAKRWRYTSPFVVMLLVVGIPANIRAFEPDPLFGPGYFDGQYRTIVGLGNLDVTAEAPPSAMPLSRSAPELTFGWLASARERGKLPPPPELTPEQEAGIALRALIVERPSAAERGEGTCSVHTEPWTVQPAKGDRWQNRGGGLGITWINQNGPVSDLTLFDPTPSGTEREILRDGLILRLQPIRAGERVGICIFPAED